MNKSRVYAARRNYREREPQMKRLHLIVTSSIVFGLLYGCASVRGAGEIAQGRQALIAGNHQAALGYFQAAEKTDPTYVYGSDLRAGVLSYLGRAQYLNGNYSEARKTLETAVSRDSGDSVARLYLGLTIARQGDTATGAQVMDEGMKGIYEFLEYITENFKFMYGQYWDSGRAIRSAIERDRAVIASGKIDWPMLIADGEWIALQTEREPDMARLQERSQRSLSLD
jgi:tetratricopeptide (TPR) repeat protein